MDMEFSGGTMEKFSKDNGKWEPKMVMVYGLHLMAAITKANGILTCNTERENMCIHQGSTRVSLKTFANKVKGSKLSQTEIPLQVNTKMESQMAKENTNGKMEPIMKVTFSTA